MGFKEMIYTVVMFIRVKISFNAFGLLMALAMPESDKQAIENHAKIEVKPIKIQNPNNPVKRLEAVLIHISRS